ncbi:tetratricopeptide repeat protein [Spirosoma linguale]|uniref:TPR repeat-containing protein n=1 Tax=Spirosoma linguale (strain ATCC 33905 / DSM 74 / LMG 10896 / Claus 1) TaxID=504472 RepID=D2QN51_SPILD|nr:TPR repeat-containing protein [Spirosoma linguale DSM 74]
MLELTALTAFIGYIIYLRYYADQRSKAELEADRLREGITLYENDQYAQALAYFNNVIRTTPDSSVAYLYRARIYRSLGDTQAAIDDLNRGKSYDDTLAELHTESGQIHFQAHDYTTAFQDFDKAIFHSHGEVAEPYRWRGLTRQQLRQDMDAQQDMDKASRLDELGRRKALIQPPGKRAFIDRQLILNAGLTVMSGLILLYIIKKSPVIHWPYLWAAASAVGLGFLEPRKGWMLALVQVFLILVGYYGLVGPDPVSTHREVEVFSLFGSVGLTFAGSLIGSVLRKAYKA